MQGITWVDYLLLPLYLWLIYRTAFYFRDKFYPVSHPYRPYFLPGLTVKICGALFIGMFYNYVYKGGDTLNFFFHSDLINSTITESIPSWFRLMTHTADDTNMVDAKALSEMYWYDDLPSYTTACLGAVIGLFCLTKYLIINIIIASITFIGMWLMFVTFASQYKAIIRYVAAAVLFMPGVTVWGSGLFKDSFCMLSIGCLVYAFYEVFVKKKFNRSPILLMLAAVILLIVLKAYILIILIPALLIQAILRYKKTLADHPEKRRSFYFLVAGMALLFIFLISTIVSKVSQFSYQDIVKTIVEQKNWLLQQSLASDGSAYDLGDFDPSFSGLMGKALPSINVTLFRPYIWESRNLIMFFTALESTAVLFLTLYLILRRNIFQTLKRIYNDPNLIMCLFFTLLFGFLVGISSYNFGTLSRYKIPCMPFYMLFLMILIFNKEANTKGKLQAESVH